MPIASKEWWNVVSDESVTSIAKRYGVDEDDLMVVLLNKDDKRLKGLRPNDKCPCDSGKKWKHCHSLAKK